jgi:hypothetical protein
MPRMDLPAIWADVKTMSSDVPRVLFSELTPAIIQKGIPFVISGALRGVEDWSLDRISREIGAQEYKVRIYGNELRSKPKTQWKQYCRFRTLSVNHYIQLLRDRIAHKENMYMAQIPFGGTSLADLIWQNIRELQDKCDLQPSSDLNLWLGPSGHTEPLHFDLGHGTLIQLHGVKHISLFPPEQSINLYPFPLHGPIPPHFSRVDTCNPDFMKFPHFSKALKCCSQTLLRQSEILFIPTRWWHEVTALGTEYVCSVNRFWLVSTVK